MKKSPNVTQAQIAQMLNLSTVTVSKALRNHPDISSETIRRVKALAKELGYSPNLIARALSSRHSHILGVVVPEIDHSFFAAVMQGIYTTAKENDYHIVLTVSHEDDLCEIENLRTLIALRVDGILISVSQKTREMDIFRWIAKKRVPLVFFDRVLPLSGFSRVVVDDKRGAYEAVSYAIHQGFQRIGHITGPLSTSIAEARFQGYVAALKDHGRAENPKWVVQTGFSEDDGYTGLKKLADANLGDLPEVIIAVNDPVAVGVYEAAFEMGLRIPEDLGVIGFSDNRVVRYLTPPLTTVRQPASAMGKQAVELLIQQINDPEGFSPQEVVIPTELVVRGSCIKASTGLSEEKDLPQLSEKVERKEVGV